MAVSQSGQSIIFLEMELLMVGKNNFHEVTQIVHDQSEGN